MNILGGGRGGGSSGTVSNNQISLQAPQAKDSGAASAECPAEWESEPPPQSMGASTCIQLPLASSSRHNEGPPLSKEAVAAKVRDQMMEVAAEMEAAILAAPQLGVMVQPLIQQLGRTIARTAAQMGDGAPHPTEVDL
jgi:hypothetical protein